MELVFLLLIGVALLAYFFDAIEVFFSDLQWVLLLGFLAALALW